MAGHLVVRNEAQRVLFEEELKGQISDGMWENTRPFDHWKAWSDAKVSVAEPGHEHLIGRNFFAMKDNYNFASKALLDVVGDRMIEAVVKDKIARGEPFPGYGWSDLRADLKDLMRIVRIQRDRTEAEAAEDRAEAQEAERRRKAARAQLEAEAAELNEVAKELGLNQYWPTWGDEGRATHKAHALLRAALGLTKAASLRDYVLQKGA
jgi:hypothetical protein